jgi:hypothetical protein
MKEFEAYYYQTHISLKLRYFSFQYTKEELMLPYPVASHSRSPLSWTQIVVEVDFHSAILCSYSLDRQKIDAAMRPLELNVFQGYKQATFE